MFFWDVHITKAAKTLEVANVRNSTCVQLLWSYAMICSSRISVDEVVCSIDNFRLEKWR
jgi:hypothetical protein